MVTDSISISPPAGQGPSCSTALATLPLTVLFCSPIRS